MAFVVVVGVEDSFVVAFEASIVDKFEPEPLTS
jgi:hypothetical protein